MDPAHLPWEEEDEEGKHVCVSVCARAHVQVGGLLLLSINDVQL